MGDGRLASAATIVANELLLEGGIEMLARTCLALDVDLSAAPVDEPIADYYRRRFVEHLVGLGDEWRDILERNVRRYAGMDADEPIDREAARRFGSYE